MLIILSQDGIRNCSKPLASHLSTVVEDVNQLNNGIVYGIVLIQTFQTAADSFLTYSLVVAGWGDPYHFSHASDGFIILDNMRAFLEALSTLTPQFDWES